jgi:hypothetical protein
VDLKFRSMEDFRPESVVQQVEPLRKLLEARTKLADLRNKLAGNDKLEDILNDVLTAPRSWPNWASKPPSKRDDHVRSSQYRSCRKRAPAAAASSLLDHIVEQSKVAKSSSEHAAPRI